jgi:hypothetical protein
MEQFFWEVKNMIEDQVREILAEIRNRKPFIPEYSKLSPPSIIQCTVLPPVCWDREVIESSLGVKFPEELTVLWEHASEIRLYEDINYGQWGCILWSPTEIVSRHKEAIGWRGPDDFRPGDLIIGEFRGDPELVVIRCDPQRGDFGSVMIALAMDPRNAWPTVGSSICEFIHRYLATPDRKYWDPAG